MQLREYQRDALNACWDYLRTREGNPAIVLPTGAGKSPLMAAISQEAVEAWQGRVGIIAHSVELVRQNYEKLRMVWPAAPAGIYAASLRRRDRFDKILVMQIQSVAKRAHELGRFDILLIDEGHRVSLKDEGMFRGFIDDCRKFNPNLRIVILTATPFRLQGKAVPICGPNYIATAIAYEARITDLIAGGYLSPLTSPKAGITPDLSGVHKRGGEWIDSELADAMMAGDLVERTITDLLQRAVGRKAGIIFCVNVKHAEAVLAELHKRGEHAALVHGGTLKSERDGSINKFQAGGLRWMVNVNVLSEGFDAPHIDCVSMLRPTESPGLYYQQVGRGLRLSPGKVNCLVADYSGNALLHGPIDQIRVSSARPGKPAKVERGTSKECPTCAAIVPMSARQCPECGHQFGSADPSHSDTPVNAPVLSTERERIVTTHTVSSVNYARHAKPGKTPSLKVTYHCGLRRFSEWICVEHTGFIRAKALTWWQRRSNEQPPRTVEEAIPLAWKLPTPLSITVDETNKYPEILECKFEREEPEQSRTPDADLCSLPDSSGPGIAPGANPVPGVHRVPEWLLPAVEGASTGRRAA